MRGSLGSDRAGRALAVVDREVISCLCILMGGCMAMTRGRSQIIEIRSNPPGATVSIRPVDSNLLSPAHVELRRKPPSTVNVPEAGHEGVAYVGSLSRAAYKDSLVLIVSRVSGNTLVRIMILFHPAFREICSSSEPSYERCFLP